MAINGARDRWELEVVRGREPGRRHVLADGETTVGNAPGGAPRHLSLADQEGASPRRMTGKQAALIVSGGNLAIRDLDGPGGTFVNHQRLLSGVDRPLSPGDEVQLGGVRLVVRRESQRAAARPSPPPSPIPPPLPSAPARSGPLSAPYTFPGGSVCRSWDDFLALSAQRWELVRDELVSGRIAEHLRGSGRADLLPRKASGWSADDVVDDWLGRLPITRSTAPELDVHPESLVIRAGGGGIVRRTIRVSNVGYRLLRSTVRVESSGTDRIRLVDGGDGATFATIDETDVELEIELPEGGSETTLGVVVVESNGGSKRVEIRLERARAETITIGDDDPNAGLSPIDLGCLISPSRRLWLFPLVLVGAHLLTAGREPRLSTLAMVGSVFGFLAGTGLGAARGGDVGASGFAGAVGGLLASALAFAAIRSAAGLVGPAFATGPAAVVLWGLIGVGLALASWIAFPAGKGEGT